MKSLRTLLIVALLAGLASAQDSLPPTASGAEPVPQAEAQFDTTLALWTAAWPHVGGKLSGPAHVQASWTATPLGVHRRFVVTSDAAFFAGRPLGRLDARIDLPPSGDARLEMETRGPAAEALRVVLAGALELDLENGRLGWADTGVRLEVDARGLDLALVDAYVPGSTLVGRGDVALRIDATSATPTLEGTLRSVALGWLGIPAMPFEAVWSHEAETSRIKLGWGGPSTARVDVTAALPLVIGGEAGLGWDDHGTHRVEISAANLDARTLAPLFDLPRGVDASFTLRAAVGGTLDTLQGDATLEGTLTQAERAPIPVKLHATTKGVAQTVELSAGSLLELQLATRAGWGALRRGEQAGEDVPMQGRVVVDAPLTQVAAFLPDSIGSPTGGLGGTVEIGGTLGHPSLSGALTARDVALTLIELNQRLSPVELELGFDGSRVTLTKLAARAGDGSITGAGALTIGGAGWSGGVELTLTDLPFVQPGLPLGTIDGRIAVGLERSDTETGLDLLLHQIGVRLTEQELPSARAIPSNHRVRLLDWLGRTTSDNELLGSSARDAKLRIELADPIDVRGADFQMQLSGTLEVARRGEVVTVQGGFDATKGGAFQLFDNPFVVRTGQATLLPGVLGRDRMLHATGTDASHREPTLSVELRDPDRPTEGRPLDPVVDFTAEARVIDTLVVVQVRGPASRPELVLLSNPALPEYEILALLITGRVDAVDQENGEVRRKAAELVQSFHNPSLKRQLFDRMGVDKIGLGFGASASEPILTVGKQLNRRVYVETIYHHNAPPEENTTAGRVEYRLDPWWTLDTTVGDAGNGNVGVFWTHRFGGPPPPGPEALAKLGVRALPDRDGDQLADTVDQCLDEPEDADGFEDVDGCPDTDNDRDGIPDVRDRAPNAAETRNGFEDEDGAPDDAPQVKSGLAIAIAPVVFLPGSARPQADDLVLQALVALMRDLHEVSFVVAGHADARGRPEANQRVSELRATSARDLLLKLGADPERLSVVGRGSSQPLDPGDTPEAHAKNRRVELEVTPTRVAEPTER